MAIEFRVLGPLELSADGRVLPLGSLKQRGLLGLLLVHANETLSRDRLIDELWGESPPATVESALHVYLSRLRKLLDGAGAGGALVHEPWGYSLRVGREELDLSRFERLVGEGREALAAGDPERAAERLRVGLALWRGPPLADLQSERFAIDAAARWEEERVVALEQRLEADLALGRDQELVGELEKLVADHPYRERLRAQLMLALYRCGRQVEALEAYQQARQILAAELGLEPGQELRQLERAILANDPELAVKPRLRQAESAPEAAVAAPIEERKVVTVLVAAVRVMHDVAALDPEDLRAVQERHLNLVRPAVEQHGGTVESVTGNSVTAVFGAPRVHEDDPERAVRTALAIRDEAARTRLEVGIGVATGEALVQHEADSSAGARVVGSIVEIAARLAADGREGHVLAAERTYHATTSVVEYREREPRDGTTAIRAWEALAAPSQPRAPETGGQRSSPFVGRERELALLVAALARVREQWEPELVTLVGAPGIGKTRVVEELRRSAEDRADPEVAWLQGRSLPYGDGVSFWALAEIVKAQAGILESDTDALVEEKLRYAVDDVLRDERETGWVHQHLRPLLGVADGRAAAGGDRDETFAAWRRFFEALAERRPLVVVFEDLHWADETLLDFVEGLAEWIGAAPLLVVGTGRPELLERRPQWGGGKQNAFTISLGPLSDTDSARLLAALSQRLRPGVETDASLLAKIGGNPFFAEQYARAVDEQAQTRELPLPDSVQAMIAARLDMLPAGEKSLLQDAAVIGKTFWAGAAAALDGLDRSAADERLRLLERKQFVQHAVHSAVAGETEYAFRHLLLRDVAYAQIPRAVRAAKHQAGAAWIESLGRPHDHAEALAHHYECALKLSKASGADIAEIAPRARLALRDAGERTFALNAPAAAAGYFERALELWPEDDRDRPRLLFRYAEALHATGDARQEQMLMRAREANVMAGDVDTAAEADALLAKMWWLIAGREGVDRHLERAARLIHGRPTSASKARVLAQLAHLHYFALMDSKEAIRVGSEALTLCDRLGLPQLQADVLITVGMARQNTPDYAAGIGEVEQGLELALASNALTAARRGYFNLAGLIMVFRGDLARHDELLHEAELLDERLGDIRSVRRTKWIRLSTNTFWRGDWDEVLQFADEFIAECEAGKPDALESSARAMRATICLARDDHEGALADCEKAIPHARRIAMSDATLVVLAVCAMIYVELGRLDEARSLTDEILSHDPDTVRFVTPWLALNAEALGTHAEVQTLLARFRSENPWLPCMRLILDGCYELAADELICIGDASDAASLRLRAGQALASEGRADEAKAQLQEALAFYRSVGATRYIRQAEGLLAAAREAPEVAAEAPR